MRFRMAISDLSLSSFLQQSQFSSVSQTGKSKAPMRTEGPFTTSIGTKVVDQVSISEQARSLQLQEALEEAVARSNIVLPQEQQAIDRILSASKQGVSISEVRISGVVGQYTGGSTIAIEQFSEESNFYKNIDNISDEYLLNYAVFSGDEGFMEALSLLDSKDQNAFINFYSVLKQSFSGTLSSPVSAFNSVLNRLGGEDQVAYIENILDLAPKAAPLGELGLDKMTGTLGIATSRSDQLLSLLEATYNSDDSLTVLNTFRDISSSLLETGREGEVDSLFGLFAEAGNQIDRVVDFLNRDDQSLTIEKVNFLLAFREPYELLEGKVENLAGAEIAEKLLGDFFDYIEENPSSQTQLKDILIVGSQLSRDVLPEYIEVLKMRNNNDTALLMAEAKELIAINEALKPMERYSFENGIAVEIFNNEGNLELDQLILGLLEDSAAVV